MLYEVITEEGHRQQEKQAGKGRPGDEAARQRDEPLHPGAQRQHHGCQQEDAKTEDDRVGRLV